MAFGIASPCFWYMGGIAITQHLMVAVVSTKRTHEIGISKSLRVRRQDILNQFLVAWAALAAIAGLIVLYRGFPAYGYHSHGHLRRPWKCRCPSVALGVGLSLSVGLFFGKNRARQASKPRSHRCVARGIIHEFHLTAFRPNTMLAFDTIRAHKLRSFLTMLGVILSARVLSLVSAPSSSEAMARLPARLKSFGPNSVIVSREPAFRTTDLTSVAKARQQFDRRKEKGVPVQPTHRSCPRLGHLWLIHGPIVINLKATPSIKPAERVEDHTRRPADPYRKGRSFTEFEDGHRATVAVIGEDITKALFGAKTVDKIINDQCEQFQVIGTMYRPSASFFDTVTTG